MTLLSVRTIGALAFAALSLSFAAVPFAVVSAPAMAQDKNAPAATADKPAEDVVVAVVNGQNIMRSDVEMARASLPPQYRQMPLQLIFPALLDQLIDGRLLAAEGRKENLQNDPDVKRRLVAIEDQLIQQAFLTRELDKKITPEALKARYDKFIKDKPPEDEVKARHILVKTEDEAKAIIAQLKKGGDFDKIAKEKSTDKGSGAQGGDLGWFKKGDMVAEFADAAFKLKKGEVTPTPVKTQFGYHVIRVDDRRQAPPPKFEEVEDELRSEMSREIVTAIIDEVRGKAKIERFNIDGSKVTEDKKPDAAPGGDAKPGDKK